MRTRSRRRSGWAAAGALAVAAGAPSLAHAQQSGLFPLAPINRERVPCAMEDPVYRMYRHEYFGYHPTCWRRFPAGWGCPSPEAPDAAKAFQILPRDKPPADAGEDQTAPEGEMNPPPPGGEARPPAAGPGQPNPNALPPLPAGGRNPFDLDTPPATPPARGNANPPAADAPGGSASSADAGLPPVVESSPPAPGPAAGAEQPLLGLPEPSAAALPAANPTFSAPAAAVPGPGVSIPPPPPGPVTGYTNTSGPFQAPRRTSVIGNLFSGRFFRR